MKEVAIKAYKIPVEAPRDLIEEYFKIKKIALDELLSYIKYSKNGKAHLYFKARDRRRLRDKLLKDWKYSKHYVDSAINSAIGVVKGWIKLHNGGRAKSKPEITKKTVYIKNTLFTYRDGVLKISIEPRRRYLIVNLRKYKWIPRDFAGVGGLILTENKLIVTLKKKVELKEPKKWASFDINLTNITALIDGKIVKYDLKKLYHIHRVYELKRRKIQKLFKHKPKTAKRLMEKYSRRERNRAKNFMHKLSTGIAKELSELKSGAILEYLRNIKSRVLNKPRNLNRKLSKWNARQFQFMLEYKLKWLGLPVKYVNPANSSKTCPVCQAEMSAYRGRLMMCRKCRLIIDRDVVAILNLQMRGAGVPPRALLGALTPMMGKRLVDESSYFSYEGLPTMNPYI